MALLEIISIEQFYYQSYQIQEKKIYIARISWALLATLLNMEKVTFACSMKNIPIPDGKSYKLQSVQKVMDFMKNIR